MNKNNSYDRFVLFAVRAAQVRSIQDAGIRFKHDGRSIYTGPIVAQLDTSASATGNLGLFDLETGKLKIRWTFLISMPFLADAYALEAQKGGSATLRTVFEEEGYVTREGRSFQVEGPGQISDDMGIFDGTIIASTNGGNPLVGEASITELLMTGEIGKLSFHPDYSTLTVELPLPLGGTSHSLSLTGAFAIQRIMSLAVDPLSERIYQGTSSTLHTTV